MGVMDIGSNFSYQLSLIVSRPRITITISNDNDVAHSLRRCTIRFAFEFRCSAMLCTVLLSLVLNYVDNNNSIQITHFTIQYFYEYFKFLLIVLSCRLLNCYSNRYPL